MKINKIESKDIKEIAKLYTQVFNSPPWNEYWEINWAYERLDTFYNNGKSIGFYIEHERKISGAILGRVNNFQGKKECEICELFVDLKHQNKKIGSKLYQQLKEYAQTLEIKTITLLTSNRTPAFEFYKKKGFCQNEDIVFMYQCFD